MIIDITTLYVLSNLLFFELLYNYSKCRCFILLITNWFFLKVHAFNRWTFSAGLAQPYETVSTFSASEFPSLPLMDAIAAPAAPPPPLPPPPPATGLPEPASSKGLFSSRARRSAKAAYSRNVQVAGAENS